MKKYQFTLSVKCGGVNRTAGEIVAEDQIPDGSLGSLLRTGMAVEYAEPLPAVEPTAKPAKEPKSKADKE